MADPNQKRNRRVLFWLRVGLVAAVLIAYSPLFMADFTVWDDTYNVSENPRLSPPSFATLAFYWTHSAYDIYIPLTYTVWAAIARVAYVSTPDASGSHLNPYLFHVANVMVHAGSVLMVFQILLKLLREKLAAAVGAVVFALHPIQVEAVGWVAGMKDVLAGFLSLVAIVLYLPEKIDRDSKCEISNETSKTLQNMATEVAMPVLKEEKRDGFSEASKLRFALATLAVILAMLAKPIAMMTPLVAMAIDWLALKRFRWRVLIWLVPATGCAIVARLSQPAPFGQLDVPLWARPVIAGDAIAFYLYKLIWPMKLGVDYGRTPRETLAHGWVYLTALVPLAIAIMLWIKRRAHPLWLAGAAVFVLALLPVSGLTRFDFQIYSTVADHYLYLPMLGVAIVAGALAMRMRQMPLLVTGVVLMLALGARTFLQTTYWQDSFTLFNHALAVNPRSWMSHNNLATASIRAGRPADAEAHLRASLAIKSDITMNYGNLAETLRLQGKSAEAIQAYRRSLMIDKSDFQAWTGLGHILTQKGDLAGAINAYQHAMDADPNDPKTRINLASALAEKGQLDRAIELYQSALKLDPNSPEAQEGLARAAAEQQKRKSTTDNHD